MKPKRFVALLLSIAIWLCTSGHDAAQAQAPGALVSVPSFDVNGGVVNFVAGDTRLKSGGNGSEKLLIRRQLINGDVIETGPHGRAEILLLPGYYLRLDENSECTFWDLTLDNQKLVLGRGSAIFEVLVWQPLYYEAPCLYEPVTVMTPHGDGVLTGGGLFLFNVSGERTTFTAVTGEAFYVDGRVREGEQVIARSNTRVGTTSKSGPDNEFMRWSRDRAEMLASVNSRVKSESWYSALKRGAVSSVDGIRTTGPQKELYTVGVAGGLVSLAEPGTERKRGEAGWEAVPTHADLAYGDRVRTAPGTRSELVLGPSFSVCLSGQSEIAYSQPVDGQGQLYILRGSAIISTYARMSPNDSLRIATPLAVFDLRRAANCRVNMDAAKTELLVRVGKVWLGKREIDAGHRVVFGGGTPTVSRGDKVKVDSFDLWSSRRAWARNEGPVVSSRAHRYLRFYHKQLPSRVMGFWYYLASLECYTFVGGHWDLRSPYGGRYGVRILERLGLWLR
ncbi:MAG TPA: FecR domain-containing protein [Blastocatellia bacterium]|nr:FecR domain-containing protein [Blastocatellia bacterium]